MPSTTSPGSTGGKTVDQAADGKVADGEIRRLPRGAGRSFPGPEQDLSDGFVQAGVIHKFVLQFELSWRLLRALLVQEGDRVSATGSPSDVIKASSSRFECLDEETWISMLRDCSAAPGIFDPEDTGRLADTVVDRYLPAFEHLADGIRGRYGDRLERIP